MTLSIPAQTADGKVTLLECSPASSGYAIAIQTADGQQSLIEVVPATAGDEYAFRAQTADGKIVLVTPKLYLGQYVEEGISQAAGTWTERWTEVRDLVQPEKLIKTEAIAFQTRYFTGNGPVLRIHRDIGRFSTAGLTNVEAHIVHNNNFTDYGSIDVHLIKYDGFQSIGSDLIDNGTIIHTWTASLGTTIENFDMTPYMPASNFYLSCIAKRDYDNTIDFIGTQGSLQVRALLSNLSLQEIGESSSST